jgi:phosphatidylserine/phosphatidylglycerophosphate/cardiolipin synthase-like enzyme
MLSSPLLDALLLTAETLPPSAVRQLAASLEGKATTSAALNSVALPQERIVVQALLDRWASEPNSPTPSALAAALLTAAHTRTALRRRTETALVWTGPTAPEATFRRTDQALQQVIESAQSELLIVTFAAYRVPHLLDALRKAVARGITVRFVAESPEESEGKLHSSLAHALGDLLDSLKIYVWPRERRATDEAGRFGMLHAKCALADRKMLLVSSANFTENALLLNMELGLLVTGGPLPEQVYAHFQSLEARGDLSYALHS